MGAADKIKKTLTQASHSVESLVKIPLMSRPCPKGGEYKGEELVVLGNGPSLRQTMECHSQWLGGKKKLAVNFAANSPEFHTLKPELYVLADPHFFGGEKTDANVSRLWDNIKQADWGMALYVPVKFRKAVEQRVPANISVKCFNLTPIEGWKWLRHKAYNSGLGMPRPRNVLIPALMIAIREGFAKIWLAGADHSWLQTLWVDNENHVVSVQPHFYEDNEKEKARVHSEYKGYHLHDILESMTVAFRSYFDIREFAEAKGTEIVNITPGSYIDAFRRGEPPTV